jgi:hypothetical protein
MQRRTDFLFFSVRKSRVFSAKIHKRIGLKILLKGHKNFGTKGTEKLFRNFGHIFGI